MSPDKDPRPDFSDVVGGSSSTTPSPRGAMPAPRTYTVVKGDSLSKIAKSIYGKVDKWRMIYDANKTVLETIRT